MREVFQFLDDPHCKKIGTQTWLVVAVIITEVLITLKFDWSTFTKPLPQHVALAWIIGLVALAVWTLWNFYIQRLLTAHVSEHHDVAMAVTASPAAMTASRQNITSLSEDGYRKRNEDDVRLRHKVVPLSSSVGH
jgi:hypothetical protein